MNTIPGLSEKEIRQRVGEQSFRRGQEYARSGAIFDTRRHGMTLKARCAGSRAEPYRLWATLSEQGVVAADCSCPVGSTGACKHVVALLLTWLRKPDGFLEQEDLDAALERRSKEELIALVKQMLRQRPDLEPLLETPLPGAGIPRAPVDPEIYRRQAAAVFARAEDWGDGVHLAEELLAIVHIGDGFLREGDHPSAAAVYTAIAEEAIEGYELFNDDEGELAGVVAACVDGLGACLEDEQVDVATRETILNTLFAVYRFDVGYGGVGLGDEVPGLVLGHATPAEQRTVAAWVREALAALPEERYSSWKRERYGGFLLELEADTLDDDGFLQVCRETGRTDDLVDRLLTLGRLEEARIEAERADDYTLLQLVDIFIGRDHGYIADALMLDRSLSTKDSRLLAWLIDRCGASGDTVAALGFAVQAFRLNPEIESYQEVRALAGPLGRWDELRPALLGFLAEHDHTWLLVHVHLADGEIDEALEALQLFSSAHPFTPGFRLRQEVAAAAEASRPRAAIAIYQQQAEALIGLRARGHYQDTCRLLGRMHGLYQGLGEEPQWASYIGALRERHRNLRALKEELVRAGL